MNMDKSHLRLKPCKLFGGLVRQEDETPIANAVWYIAKDAGAGLSYRIPAGLLADMKYLTLDLLVDGYQRAPFIIVFQEGENGGRFEFLFSALNQCSARVRFPLESIRQKRCLCSREGAFINPKISGARIDINQVDRLTFSVGYKAEDPVRWCMTDLTLTVEKPPRLTRLVLPKGPLLDELGQSATWDWPGKSKSADEVTIRLNNQLKEASAQKWPGNLSRWGGWREKRFDATGFFRTQNDGKRWWLVDPDGYAFWSTGLDCIRVDTTAATANLESALTWLPEKNGQYAAAFNDYGGAPGINYLAANFIRAFGPEGWYDKWAEIAFALLRRFGFNTVGNWSDWQLARKAGFPYVRNLPWDFPNTPKLYAGFPDVYDPHFESDAQAFAEPLRESMDDPAMIGYFLMNEPGWLGPSTNETPAAGMLFNIPRCASREKLAGFLREKYHTEAELSSAWGIQTTFARISEGPWTASINENARTDLKAFSTIMTTRLCDVLSSSCRKVDPNHLNLGVRSCSCTPARWALKGMKSFDVFSINWYYQRPDEKAGREIADRLNMPVLIGEWHYGALDVGLPSGGLRRVRDQEARGKAYRVYIEDAASRPWCVGAHWFTLYDESALGRFDGENFNCGFLDVCNRPYDLLAKAARASHERIYAVADGKTEPFKCEVWYNVRP